MLLMKVLLDYILLDEVIERVGFMDFQKAFG